MRVSEILTPLTLRLFLMFVNRKQRISTGFLRFLPIVFGFWLILSVFEAFAGRGSASAAAIELQKRKGAERVDAARPRKVLATLSLYWVLEPLYSHCGTRGHWACRLAVGIEEIRNWKWVQSHEQFWRAIGEWGVS